MCTFNAAKVHIIFIIANTYYLLFYIADLNQVLTNLYGIEGSTLANLVAREPEGESVLVAQVFAHTTHEDIVLTSRL